MQEKIFVGITMSVAGDEYTISIEEKFKVIRNQKNQQSKSN